MPKLKTHRGAKKRFKVSSTKKAFRFHAFKSHLLAKKARKRKRRLGQKVEVSQVDKSRLKQMLPYQF